MTEDEQLPGEPADTPVEDFEANDPGDEDAPAWVRGAGVRWFGVIVFLLMGVVALLVFLATILAIYDRARDDSPPGSSPSVGSLTVPIELRYMLILGD